MRAAQREVVEAAGGNAVGAVERAHVGAAQREVRGDDGLDLVIAQHEVADDAVGLLAARKLVLVVRANLEGGWRGEERQRECDGGEQLGQATVNGLQHGAHDGSL